MVRSDYVYRKHVRGMSAGLCVKVVAQLVLTKATVSHAVKVQSY